MKILVSKLITLSMLLLTTVINAQEKTATVESKGIGIRRDDAIKEALRSAVEQVAGSYLLSETRVENFAVIKDAISTNTNGYVTKYDVIKENPVQDGYEVDIKATVSTDPLKADFKILAKSMGGVRFLVAYNPADVGTQKDNYEYAIERFNEYLSGKGYRYLDKNRFDQLKNEAFKIYAGNGDDASYVQKLGMMSDAQFIILIKKIHFGAKTEAFGTRQSQKVTIEAKAYDNCTAEGLGTIVMESNWTAGNNGSGARDGITQVINNDAKRLLTVFTSYIGDWVNNGAPYELRFYSTGTYRELKDLREQLKNDSRFGGDFEIVSTTDYTKMNCTFREKPEDLTDKVLEYADNVPALKPKKLDVKLLYGRQISFAPQGVKLPSELKPSTPTATPAVTTPVEAKPVESTKPVSTETSSSTPSNDEQHQFSMNQKGECGVKVFSEKGELFYVVIDGKRINSTPLSSVEVTKMSMGQKKMKIIFEDSKIEDVSKTLYFQNNNHNLSYELRFHEKKTKKNKLGKTVYDIYTVDWGNIHDTDASNLTPSTTNQGSSNTINSGNTIINISGSGINIGNNGINTGSVGGSNLTPAKGCLSPLNYNQFNVIKTAVNSAMLHDRSETAQNLIRNKCLSVSQIKELTQTLMLQDKLQFLKAAYFSCYDKDNYVSLGNLLMLHERNEFNVFVAGN